MVPSASRISACRRVTRVPAGPRTRSRFQPAKFCPRSATNTPGSGSVIATGRISRRTVTPGSSAATSCGFAAVETVTAVQSRSFSGTRTRAS
jgi:hypothetical protein